MKKKNLKSLDLNKKVISNLEASKVEGGFIITITLPTVTCTFGEVCQAIGETIDAFIQGYEQSGN